jgi:hypothetical protein
VPVELDLQGNIIALTITNRLTLTIGCVLGARPQTVPLVSTPQGRRGNGQFLVRRGMV